MSGVNRGGCSGCNGSRDERSLVAAALEHAWRRLNDIAHNYKQTDFKLLRDGLAAAKQIAGPARPEPR